jgi:DNA repair photolyase
VTDHPTYEYSLSVTSQFYFCGLPLRLDSYGSCLYACQYCFAAARGGRRTPKALRIADAGYLSRLLSDVGRTPSVVREFLAARQPIHFGGMSDPFPMIEAKLQISLRLLEILAEHRYPTVISTKGTLMTRPDYLAVLSRGDFLVQVSFSTSDDRLSAAIDLGTPSPTARRRALAKLADAGIKTACRLQPLLPGREVEGMAALDQCAEVGAAHVGVEYLKLPIERWSGTARLSKALSRDLRLYYASVRAQRVGREWVLPIELRLPTILSMRDRAHELGMSFGAADTDLLPMSDSACCCSGADVLLRGGRSFEFNYLGAVRRATSTGVVNFSSLSDVWTPTGSMARMINSRSRLRGPNGSGASLADYIKANWNGRNNGCSPQMFHGVEPTGHVDTEGLNVYRVSGPLRHLLEGRSAAAPTAGPALRRPTSPDRDHTLG